MDMNKTGKMMYKSNPRRGFLGGSDARVIMGTNEAALLRLWHEKRGEVGPEDLSDNLLVQLGNVTEPLNRSWFERNTGQAVSDVQGRLRHPVLRWIGATLDGRVERDRGRVRGKIHAALVLFRSRPPPRSTCRNSSTTCG